MGKITGGITIPYDQKVVNDLTFPNPYEPEKSLEAYFEDNGNILIPRGYPLDIEGFTDNLVEAPCTFKLAEGYKLRDYQEVAVNEIVKYFSGKNYGQLLLQAATGSGKTVLMAKLTASLGQRTLVLSHLTMLGSQMLGELTKNTSECTIKMLNAKSINEPIADISIGTFQLLDASEALLKYLGDNVGLVIVDEADMAFTSSRLTVLFKLRPKYQVYLTATPSRELMRQTSGLQYLYDKTVVMAQPEESKIHSRHIMLDYRHTHWQSPMNTNMYKVSLHAFYKQSGIINDVVTLCNKLVANRGTIWVVVDRVKLQDELTKLLLAKGVSVETINGSTNAKQRDRILGLIASEDLNVVLGSAPLSAGLSIPNLAYGIRLMPNSSSEELLFQMTGRLNRNAPFKAEQPPVWYDFAISGSLENGGKKRFKLYRQSTLGVELITMLKALE